MAIYKHMFLQPESITLVPPDLNNGKQKRHSTPSIQWLMYVSEKEKICIQSTLQGDEYQVGLYFPNGHAVVNGVLTAFEYNSCFYHRCSQYYKLHQFNTQFEQLCCWTLLKVHYIKNLGIVVRSLWEYEWLVMIKSNKELMCFIKNKKSPEPCDALFRGCTIIPLYKIVVGSAKIHYYDFTNIYCTKCPNSLLWGGNLGHI